ncbi:hypothetical protein Scep_022399 [Stephania cephalantha]|uniref:Uncharacterized protein n=1 Tax=Stephania cephalantha TaxID=152367 RepID=A0AAP0I281_9MAGN
MKISWALLELTKLVDNEANVRSGVGKILQSSQSSLIKSWIRERKTFKCSQFSTSGIRRRKRFNILKTSFP